MIIELLKGLSVADITRKQKARQCVATAHKALADVVILWDTWDENEIDNELDEIIVSLTNAQNQLGKLKK